MSDAVEENRSILALAREDPGWALARIRRASALEAEVKRLRELLRWALPYVPEPLPSMEGGEFAESYHEAVRRAGVDGGSR